MRKILKVYQFSRISLRTRASFRRCSRSFSPSESKAQLFLQITWSLKPSNSWGLKNNIIQSIWIPQIAVVPLVGIQIHLLLLKSHKKRDVLITIKTNSFVINSRSLSKWVSSALSLQLLWPRVMSFLKLTALLKRLFKRLRLSLNQSYNLRFQNQRRRRTERERHQALRLTGHHKKTKSYWDSFKSMEMLLGIDFASLWPIKLKLDASKDIWRSLEKVKREKKELTRKLPQ